MTPNAATTTASQAVHHTIFTLRRRLPFAPATVFAAWASPEAKARWFAGGGGWTEKLREMDFRVGGRERVIGQWAVGSNHATSDFQAIYHDIVSNQRIVYSYDMFVGDTKLSVSLATIEFQADGTDATQLVLTEQGAFFDDKDPPMREHGTHFLMDQLTSALHGVSPVGPDVAEREIVITPADQRAARAGLCRLDRPATRGPVVGPDRLHHHDEGKGRAPRRRVALHHARPGRHGLPQRGALPAGGQARAAGVHAWRWQHRPRRPHLPRHRQLRCRRGQPDPADPAQRVPPPPPRASRWWKSSTPSRAATRRWTGCRPSWPRRAEQDHHAAKAVRRVAWRFCGIVPAYGVHPARRRELHGPQSAAAITVRQPRAWGWRSAPASTRCCPNATATGWKRWTTRAPRRCATNTRTPAWTWR